MKVTSPVEPVVASAATCHKNLGQMADQPAAPLNRFEKTEKGGKSWITTASKEIMNELVAAREIEKRKGNTNEIICSKKFWLKGGRSSQGKRGKEWKSKT